MNIEKLFAIIEDRVKSKKKRSYTNDLLKSGSKKIAQKFGEESAELIVDYLKGTKKRTIARCDAGKKKKTLIVRALPFGITTAAFESVCFANGKVREKSLFCMRLFVHTENRPFTHRVVKTSINVDCNNI